MFVNPGKSSNFDGFNAIKIPFVKNCVELDFSQHGEQIVQFTWKCEAEDRKWNRLFTLWQEISNLIIYRVLGATCMSVRLRQTIYFELDMLLVAFNLGYPCFL